MTAIDRLLERHEDLRQAYLGDPTGGDPRRLVINRFHHAMDVARAHERQGGDPLEALARIVLTLNRAEAIRDERALTEALTTVRPMPVFHESEPRRIPIPSVGLVQSHPVDMVPRLTGPPDPQRWWPDAYGKLDVPGDVLSMESRGEMLRVVTELGVFDVGPLDLNGSVESRLKWAWLRGYYATCKWLSQLLDGV